MKEKQYTDEELDEIRLYLWSRVIDTCRDVPPEFLGIPGDIIDKLKQYEHEKH